MQQSTLEEIANDHKKWLRDCKMQAIRQASLVKTTDPQGEQRSLTIDETIYQWLIK
jgi:hypothetical protein